MSAALIEALLLATIASAACAATNGTASESVDINPALSVDPADTMPRIGATDLYLDTTLNGTPAGLIHFGLREGALWVSLGSLDTLGVKLPDGTPDPVRMDTIPGVQVTYNQGDQTVSIIAPLALLHRDVHVVNATQERQPRASASPGMLLNYDLYGTRGQRNDSSLSAYTELRAFSAAGVLSTTQLTQAIRAGAAWQHRSVRMDSSWSVSSPSRLLTLTVGDTLTSAAQWSRPTRIGGIQVGSNFALEPYRVTTPIPQFTGSAVLPSQIDLYVNGMKQYSGEVPAGPFELNTIPSISGAGQAQVTLTDALGRISTLDFSLYNTPQLLRQGLTDWSVELGMVRENYGLRSFDYAHDPVGSGTWRHGVSNQFTAEIHGEATRGLVNGGVGGYWLLATAGVISGSVAASRGSGSSGSQIGLGYRWNDSRFNLSVQGTRASTGFRDVATLYGAPPPRLTASAQAGFGTSHFGSFGVSYVHLAYPKQAVSRYGSVYWYTSIGRRASLNLNLNQNLSNPRDRSLFLTYNLSLDDDTYLSAGLQRDNDRSRYNATASHPTPTAGGFGWQAQWQQGGSGRAELDYLGRYGRIDAGAYAINGNNTAYTGASGALVWMGGDVFATRRIYNGFAVVSTDGIAGVPIQLENTSIGSTNRNGLLLVSPLNAYQNNQLSIDPMDLPVNLRIGDTHTVATPTDRAGVLVRFDLTPIRAASILLVDGAGKPLPVGSTARQHGQSGEPAVVGFDGVVYLDTLQSSNRLDVETPRGTCRVHFDYPERSEGIPEIGPLTCTSEVSP